MKKFLCCFLSAVMLLGLIPVTAMAATYEDEALSYDLEVGWGGEGAEEQYWHCDNGTPDSGNELPNGVTFDAESGTLTLNGADINFIRVSDWGTNELTIKVEGTNQIHPYDGRPGIEISSCHNVTISGTGTLNIEPAGKNEDPDNQGYGNYGTPFNVWDCYLVERAEGYYGQDDHFYPDGKLVIDGVTMVLTNPEDEIERFENEGNPGEYYWSSAHNAQAMNVFMANVTLQNGAKITGTGMDGININGNLTVGTGTEITASSLEVNGLYDDNDASRYSEVDLTVNGTLTVTGDGYDVTSDKTNLRAVYRSSLRMNPGATLTLNEGGKIDVQAPETYSGCGVEISAPNYFYVNGVPDKLLSPVALGAGDAEINGGTLTVSGKNGISVCSGATWTQSGGTVTVNVDGDIPTDDGINGISVSADPEMFMKTALFTQSGGTVTINMNMGEATVLEKDENNVDGTEYAPGFSMRGDVMYAMSGAAKLNINYTGVGNGWCPGVHISPNWYEDRTQGEAKMIMSDTAAVAVDYTGFSGMDDLTGVAGFSVEENCSLTIDSGTSVTVKLPDGSVGDGTGLNISNATVTTSGAVKVNAPATMVTNRVEGISIGGNGEEPYSSFTMEGGTVDIDLEATTLNEALGISARDASTVDLNGGTVTAKIGGKEADGEDWHSAIGLDAYGEVKVTVGEGAELKFDIQRTNSETERLGIKLNDRCTYTQAANSTVEIDGVSDGDPRMSSEGLHAENHSTASINGNFTVKAAIDACIILYEKSTLEVANGAHITYDARNTEMGDGIVASDYSDVTVSGGTIDLDLPIAPRNLEGDEEGLYWMTNGLSVDSNSVANITGGTININQKTPRATTALPAEFVTEAIRVVDAFLRVTGGTLNVRGTIPVSTVNSINTTDPVTFGSGICALYADGTTYNNNPLGGFEVKKNEYTYTTANGSNINYVDYVLDPEKENLNQEFGVVIKNQSAKAEYSGLLELVNSGSVIAGQAYTARLTATLPDGTDSVTLSVDSGTIQENSVSVNGEKAQGATYAGKSATVTIKSGDIVRFNVIPGAGNNTIKASFTKANKEETATFTAKDYTMELPTSTDKETVVVTGVAAADTEVQVYVDSAVATTVKANKAGVWSATITLTQGTHTVHAVINGQNTGDKTITYEPTLPVVESLTVSNWIHGRTSADPNEETSFVINFVDPSKSTKDKYYTYWPELPEFTFRVKFSQGAERVSDVIVVATDWKGDTEEVYLSLDTDTLEWTGTHDFCDGKHITPEQFQVKWHNLEDASQGQTPTYFEEPGIADELWGEPEVEGDVYTPPETVGSRTNRFVSVTATAGESYSITVTAGATVTLKSPLGGQLDGASPSYSVTGEDGDMYVVTVEGGSFVGFDSDVDTLCISFEGEDDDGGKAYVLAETAAEDNTFNATIGATYDASGTDKTLEYLIVGSRVYRLEKKTEEEGNKYTVVEDVTQKEDLDITKVYKSFSISGFGGADLENATLEEWDGGHEELLGSVGSVPATYNINYATGEVTIDADTDAIAAEFMSTQLARDIVASAINVWSKDLDKEFEVGPVGCKAELSASFDILGETAGELTVEPKFTVTVETKTQGHFGEITETLTVEVGFESKTTIDYKLTMKRDENGNVELAGFIPKYSGHISAAEDMTFSLGLSVSVEGANAGETSFLNRYYAELGLEKYLDEIAVRDNDDENLPIAKLYIPIPAVPGLGFYFGDSVSFDYKLLGELSVNGEVNTGIEAGLIIADNEIINKTCDLKPVTQKTDITFHADASAGFGIRGDIGLSLFRVMEVGVYGKAGPRVDIKGHGKVSFATNQQAQFDAELGAQFGIAVEIGGVVSIPPLGIKPTGTSFWDDFYTRPEWSVGKKFMPTRFAVLEEEPIIVPAEINLCNVIDMNVSYQELVGSCEVKSKILDADKYEFQLYESDGKPVQLTKTGELTVTDTTKEFDFWVKLLYKVHENDEYQIWKIVPLHFAPAVIEVIKTTEEGGSRIASFTVTDKDGGKSETKSTSAAGLATFGAVPGHTYIITENSCPPGYYPATSSQTVVVEGSKAQAKFLNRKVKPFEPQWTFQATPSMSKPSRGDPSGFVYEGIESNRLQGVTTTLYHADDLSGANKAVWTQAEADVYDQTNPLTTDALGQYLWMVPSGNWQVEYKLAGYTTQTSAWMDVPPARTGVNQNMTNEAPATVTLSYSETLGCYVLRFSRPVQVSTVLDGIDLTGLPANVVGSISGLNPLDAGWSVEGNGVTTSTLCATTFAIDGFDTRIPEYDENGNEVDGQPYELSVGSTVTLSVHDVLTYMGTKSAGTAQTTVHERPLGKFRVTVINGSGSGTYAPGEEVRVSYDVRSGYTFTGWSIESELTIEISDNTFTMPECNVVLTAQYKQSGSTGGGGGSWGGGSSGSAPTKPAEPTETVRPGVVSPEETGIAETLNVTERIAYVEGGGDGTVKPDSAITRAEAAQMLFKLLRDAVTTGENGFKDVADDAWYHDAALALAGIGVIKGKNSTDTFAPNDTVTRAEFAAMCARLAKSVDAGNKFSDVPATHWAVREINTAAYYGWINGRGNGKFDPDTGITRAEAIKIINCAIGRPADGKFTGEAPSFTDLPATHWAYLEVLAAADGTKAK